MNKLSVTNFLIGVCILVTFLAIIFPGLYIFGLNNLFLINGKYVIYILQLFSSEFLHGGVLHLFMNSIFLYYFGNSLELLIGKKTYIIFFLFITIFNGTLVTIFAWDSNTIGMSGFCMALLTYFVLELKKRNSPEWKGGMTAIVLNILIGFLPGISLYGHLFGAIGGLIFYFLNKDFFRPKLVGKVLKNSLNYQKN